LHWPAPCRDALAARVNSGQQGRKIRDAVRLAAGIVLGSATDFDALAMFWNLRAAGASLIFYDQSYSARLKSLANSYLAKLREPSLDGSIRHINIWILRDRPRDDSWKPDLELAICP
jgi:hypothetical protein